MNHASAPFILIVASLVCACLAGCGAPMPVPVDDPSRVGLFELRPAAHETASYAISYAKDGAEFATVSYQLWWNNSRIEVRADVQASEHVAYHATFDPAAMRTLEIRTIDGSFIEYPKGTASLMPTARRLLSPDPFYGPYWGSIAMPVGPQLSLPANASSWAEAQVSSNLNESSADILVAGPCDTGCVLWNVTKPAWLTRFVLSGSGILPTRMELGQLGDSQHLVLQRTAHTFEGSVEAVPLNPPRVQEVPTGLVSCEWLPCEGSDLDPYFGYEEALQSLHASLQWQQWSEERTSQVFGFGVGRYAGSYTLLGEFNTPDSTARWSFVFGSTDGDRAFAKLASANLVPGFDAPLVETFSNRTNDPLEIAPDGPWETALLPAAEVVKVLLAAVEPRAGSELTLVFYNIPSPYRPNPTFAYQWYLDVREGGQVSALAIASGYTGELLMQSKGLASNPI